MRLVGSNFGPGICSPTVHLGNQPFSKGAQDYCEQATGEPEIELLGWKVRVAVIQLTSDYLCAGYTGNSQNMSKILWVNQEMKVPQAPSVVDSQICTGCYNDVERIFLAGLCLLEGRGPKGSGFLVQTEVLRLGLGRGI